jgi:hypothetical protein
MIRRLWGCLLLPLCFLGTTCSAQTTLAGSVQWETAWRTGYPRAGLKNGDTLVEWFKARAKSLGREGKLRLLIIGDGQSPPDAQTVKDRIAWYKANRYPYLDSQEGLDSTAMKRLGWFNDNIHLAQPGGQGIGEAIARLFVP